MVMEGRSVPGAVLCGSANELPLIWHFYHYWWIACQHQTPKLTLFPWGCLENWPDSFWQVVYFSFLYLMMILSLSPIVGSRGGLWDKKVGRGLAPSWLLSVTVSIIPPGVFCSRSSKFILSPWFLWSSEDQGDQRPLGVRATAEVSLAHRCEPHLCRAPLIQSCQQ